MRSAVLVALIAATIATTIAASLFAWKLIGQRTHATNEEQKIDGSHVEPSMKAPATKAEKGKSGGTKREPPERRESPALKEHKKATPGMLIGEVVTLKGPARGYAPTVQDLLGGLSGELPKSGGVVTLSPDISPTSNAYCYFTSNRYHEILLRATQRGERLAIHGRIANIGQGFISLEDCELCD